MGTSEVDGVPRTRVQGAEEARVDPTRASFVPCGAWADAAGQRPARPRTSARATSMMVPRDTRSADEARISETR